MEILNLGPLELLFIILIAFVVLGPQDAIRMARKAGTQIYKFTRSPLWSNLMSTSKEIREIPRKLAKEIEIDGAMKEISSNLNELSGALGGGEKINLGGGNGRRNSGGEIARGPEVGENGVKTEAKNDTKEE